MDLFKQSCIGSKSFSQVSYENAKVFLLLFIYYYYYFMGAGGDWVGEMVIRSNIIELLKTHSIYNVNIVVMIN